MRNIHKSGDWLGMVLLCGLLPFYLQAGERRLQGAWKIEGDTLKDGSHVFFPSGHRMRLRRSS